MEDKNILEKGIETLYTIKENLLELTGYQEKNQILIDEENSLEEEIALKEKAINDEIDSVLKKRKDEIIKSFNEELSKTKSRLKKVKSKKDKLKGAKVSERVKLETSTYEEEKTLYREEIREVFKANSISRIFNTKLYYTLFLPRSIKDVFSILLTLALVFVGIPMLVYHYLLPQKVLSLVITYAVTILFFGGLYIITNRLTKENHKEAFITIKSIRNKYYAAQKKINQTKRMIRKDKDESGYGLENFDNEIKELEQEISNIAQEQKNALVTFENSTKYNISEGIKANYQKELDEMKENHDRVYNEQRKVETKAKEFSIEIFTKYAAYIGKEDLNINFIDDLITIMETNQASTIAEAINLRKSPEYLEQKKSGTYELPDNMKDEINSDGTVVSQLEVITDKAEEA